MFGKTDGTAVELSAIEAGSGGFVINGVSNYDHSGFPSAVRAMSTAMALMISSLGLGVMIQTVSHLARALLCLVRRMERLLICQR